MPIPRTLWPLALVTAAAPLAAQSAARVAPRAESGTFVVLAGADTVAVEQFQRWPRRGGDSTVAEMRLKQPGVRIRHVVVDSLGLVPRYYTEAHPPGGAPPERGTLRFGRDTLVAEVPRGTQRVRIASGTLPFFNPSFVLVEQLVRRAQRLGGDSVTIPLIEVRGAAQFTATVLRRGRDSLVIRLPKAELRVGLDAARRVTGARVPAQNVTVVRTAGSATTGPRE